jgi:hypothetical protein
MGRRESAKWRQAERNRPEDAGVQLLLSFSLLESLLPIGGGELLVDFQPGARTADAKKDGEGELPKTKKKRTRVRGCLHP